VVVYAGEAWGAGRKKDQWQPPAPSLGVGLTDEV
jgi:hypothetical protein